VALRVSPTEAIRAQITELFSSDADLLSVLEYVALPRCGRRSKAWSKRSSATRSAGSGTSAVARVPDLAHFGKPLHALCVRPLDGPGVPRFAVRA
jgi:hypothetical protein